MGWLFCDPKMMMMKHKHNGCVPQTQYSDGGWQNLPSPATGSVGANFSLLRGCQ